MRGLITCEECGYEGMPYAFVWFQGEVAICRDGDTCRQRQLESGNMTQPPEFPIIDNQGKNQNKFIDKARQIVLDHYNEKNSVEFGLHLTSDEVYVVWFSKVLGNWKALVSTNVNDGFYYEVTHNGAKNETYLDTYAKVSNIAIPDA